MFDDPLFQRFAAQRPAAVIGHAVVARMLRPERLDLLFRLHARSQRHKTLLFSTLVRLMSAVALRAQPGVHAAWRAMKESTGVSCAAVYDKLGGARPAVSQALVRASRAALCDAVGRRRTDTPPVVPGYRTRILDGNHLAGTEHRLKELRGERAAALPGKSPVVLDPQRRAIADLFPIEAPVPDGTGHAQERSAPGDVLDTVRRDELWIADRNVCTIGMLTGPADRGAKFIIRHAVALVGRAGGMRARGGPPGRRHGNRPGQRTDDGVPGRRRSDPAGPADRGGPVAADPGRGSPHHAADEPAGLAGERGAGGARPIARGGRSKPRSGN